MSKTQLVVSGSIAIDRIMNFSGQYRDLIEASKLDVISVSVLVESLKQAHGGTGANIAYSLASLGESPILLGSVGEDATDYIKRLEAAGIDTSSVHISNRPTASFNVLTDSKDNQIGGFYPGAMSDADSLSFAAFKNDGAVFCVSAHDPTAMRRQVDECSELGLRLFYDPGQQVSNIPADDLLAGIAAAEVLIVNDYEQGVLLSKTGFTIKELQDRLPVLISTHGKNGSVISGKSVGRELKISSTPPHAIVDPTGAGDSYRAGFLYGYLRQWDYSVCGQLGSVLASFVLEQAGTQVELSKSAIAKRYQQRYNQEIEL